MNQQPGGKTRRRFLADLLFLGGGLTAAGLLARAQFGQPEPEPQIAGKVAAPPGPGPTPDPVPRSPGEMVAPPPSSPEIPPGAAGGMEIPQAPSAPVCIKTPSAEPNIAGGRRAPMANPTQHP
jgi:hypothetical protein